jgi:RNA-binding protein 5/10
VELKELSQLKITLASFGFGFVEFMDAQVMEEWYSNGFSDPSFIQSAASVLVTTMSPQIHPSGFRIPTSL